MLTAPARCPRPPRSGCPAPAMALLRRPVGSGALGESRRTAASSATRWRCKTAGRRTSCSTRLAGSGGYGKTTRAGRHFPALRSASDGTSGKPSCPKSRLPICRLRAAADASAALPASMAHTSLRCAGLPPVALPSPGRATQCRSQRQPEHHRHHAARRAARSAGVAAPAVAGLPGLGGGTRAARTHNRSGCARGCGICPTSRFCNAKRSSLPPLQNLRFYFSSMLRGRGRRPMRA